MQQKARLPKTYYIDSFCLFSIIYQGITGVFQHVKRSACHQRPCLLFFVSRYYDFINQLGVDSVGKTIIYAGEEDNIKKAESKDADNKKIKLLVLPHGLERLFP